MHISNSYHQPIANVFPKMKAARNSQPKEVYAEQPKESWSPLTLGSSLGAVIGAGICAAAPGQGLAAGLVGFGTAFVAAKLLNVARHEDNGLFLFGTMTAATVAAAYSAGPGGLALLAGGGVLAYALDKQFVQSGSERNSHHF